MATGAGKGGDIYANAANAMAGAGNALTAAGNIYASPQLTGGPTTYNPTMASAYGYNAARANPSSYDPRLFRAARTANPGLISGGIEEYLNPYTNTVINNTAADIGRTARQQTIANNASAVRSGAFGGGRQGVVDAITNSEAQKNIGDISGQLRSQAFDTAAGLSAQDVANRMATGQFNASLLQQARAANQGAINTARGFNASNEQQAALANQAAINAARGFTAGNRQTAELANQQAGNTAGQWNAGTRNAWEEAQASEALARAGGLQGVASGAAGLGQQGFNIGQAISGQQGAQGALQQQLIQQIMNAAGGQFQGWQGQPTQAINLLMSALGMNPMANTGTTTQSHEPGLFNWASLIGQSIFGGGQ